MSGASPTAASARVVDSDGHVAKAAKGSSRPTFSNAAVYEKLVPIMGATSLEELDDDRKYNFPLFQQQAKAMTLRKKGVDVRPGSFKSWTSTLEMLLSLVDLPDVALSTDAAEDSAAEKKATASAASTDADEVVDDAGVSRAMSVVESLLAGDVDIDYPDMDESQLAEMEKLLLKRCDEMEACVREQFETMVGDDETVGKVLEATAVS